MQTGSTGAFFSIVGPSLASTQREKTLCPSQQSSGKIFWRLSTLKQQTGMEDPAMVHLVLVS